MWHIKLYVALLLAVASTESKFRSQSRRSPASLNICDPQPTEPSSQIQCYCQRYPNKNKIKGAECFFISKSNDDVTTQSWDEFEYLKEAISISFTNFHEIPFREIPTVALSHLKSLIRVEIKYAHINEIKPYAFANLTRLEELTLSNNQIERLHKHAFIQHEKLVIITLDKNNLEEINREVFVGLPTLEKLYLTSNKISTIHDKAFEQLHQLEELELDKNSLFALTNETFYGLSNLIRLELSHNALEVIGDDTFASLPKMQYLNLQGNRIQVLDEKAFSGLKNLQYLSLSYNKLLSLEYDNLFNGLNSLNSLHLNGNKLQELKITSFKPILTNFYEIIGSFDIEDNNFPCNCDLEWLILLQNKTKNKSLKNQLENLKCQPDPSLAEAWKKLEDTELVEEEANKGLGNDYEYYDSSQLGGKLFYTDIRQMLNCSHNVKTSTKQKPRLKATALNLDLNVSNADGTSTVGTSTASISTVMPSFATRPQSVANMDEVSYISTPTSKNIPYKTSITSNRGVLDLSIDETTTNSKESTSEPLEPVSMESNKLMENLEDSDHTSFTTSRVASVSAKPKSDYKYEEHEMASDEASGTTSSDKQNNITQEPILQAGLGLQKITASSSNRRLSLDFCVLIAFILSISRW